MVLERPGAFGAWHPAWHPATWTDRQRQWTAVHVEAVRQAPGTRLWVRYPRWGGHRARAPKDPLAAIQIDGGSEFKASFEQACHDDHHSQVCTRRGNRVPRPGRTRRHREEFREYDDGDLDIPTLGGALQAWEEVYNAVRPHHTLDPRTPAEFLATRHLS